MSAKDHPTDFEARWHGVKFRVAVCAMRAFGLFHSSLSIWKGGEPNDTNNWSIHETGSFGSSQAFNEDAAVFVEGDCDGELTFAQQAVVHICGNLVGKLVVGRNSEIVIGGTVSPDAMIDTDGHCSVYLDGDLRGSIRNKGSVFCSIGGDCNGALMTGASTTRLSVRGNCGAGSIRPYPWGDSRDTVKPLSRQGVLRLDVGGFMAYSALEAISRFKYRDFWASVNQSDRGPGIFPLPTDSWRDRHRGRSCLWVVEQRG
jgi:hypothetical protein